MKKERDTTIWKHLGPVMIDGARYDLEEDFKSQGPITTQLLEAMMSARDEAGFTIDTEETNMVLARAAEEVIPGLDASEFNARIILDFQIRQMLMAKIIGYARFAMVLATEQFGCEDGY